MKASYAYLVLTTLLSWYILGPVLPPGVWYPMHDSTHPVRLLLMHETIMGGQFPPLWASEINHGYGWPLFQFYAPLFHLVATFLTWVFTPTTSLKITLFLTTTIGGAGVFLFAKRWGRIAATVATFAFLLSPFVALEIYVRGAYSELLSLCILPWVLLTTEELTTPARVARGALCLALFVLSHNLIPLLALPLTLVWMLYHNHLRIKKVVWTILLALGLSSWFTLPLIFERQFTKVDQIAVTTNYSLHFVEPWQLWDSTWGFGGSAGGVEDGMSFKLGKLQIALGLLGLVLAVITRKKSIVMLGLFLIISIFLATPYAKTLWDNLPPLQLVQFPWRSLGLVIIFLSLLTGFAASRLPSKPIRAVAAGAFIVLFWRFGHQYFRPESVTTDNTSGQARDIASVVPEYEPKWLTTLPSSPASTIPTVITGPVEATLPRAYYPTWRASLDGRPVTLNNSPSGLLTLTVPSGTHKLKLWQSHTTLEFFSYGLTLLAFGYWYGLLKERI